MAPSTIHEYKHEPTSNLDSVDTAALAKDNFTQLVKDLSRVLGPSSGLTCADVSVDELKALMEKYVSKQEEWDMYNFKDQSRGYTRNLVDRGNGKCNLLILVWTPGKGSPIHDHANAHCLMKVLKGSLKEVRYAWPETGVAERGPPTVIKETLYTENQVTYMSDDLGIHRICNPDREEAAVSLHLYTPPNAARYGCHIFDERTGKQSRVSQCQFFSELGRRLE